VDILTTNYAEITIKQRFLSTKVFFLHPLRHFIFADLQLYHQMDNVYHTQTQNLDNTLLYYTYKHCGNALKLQ